MLNVDEEISRIEKLYHDYTGAEPRRTHTLSAIPDDANAELYVGERLHQLRSVLSALELGPRAEQLPVVAPRIAVAQAPGEWRCTVELPGVQKADVTVKVSGGALSVRAVRRGAQIERRGQPVYEEFSACRFERVVPLPPHIRGDGATAALSDGVLTVRVPDQAATVIQEIEIGGA